MGRLLHDVAELTRDLGAPLAGHAGGLHEEDVTAHRRPGQARGHAQAAQGFIRLERGFAQQVLDVLLAYPQLLLPGFQHAHDAFAHDPRQLLFQGAHTRLPTVGIDHIFQRRIVDFELILLETVTLQLLWPQVVPGDGELLYGGEVWLEGEDLVYGSDEWNTIDMDFAIEDVNIDKVALLEIGIDGIGNGSVIIDDVVFGNEVADGVK